MNMLVFSDSHGRTDTMAGLLRLFRGQVDAVAHLGDAEQDLLRFQAQYPDTPFYTVPGNTDDYGNSEQQRLLLWAGKRVLLTHGHRQHVKTDLLRLRLLAEEMEADIGLFGHTHQAAVFEHGPVLLMNPGSIALPRTGRPTYGLLRVSDSGVAQGVILNAGDPAW